MSLLRHIALLASVALATLDAPMSAASPDACRPVVVLTGYWPPTNEMLRHWSTSSAQNPDGWQGNNWRDSGYDVQAFFPEFPPDGDPVDDEIGTPGSVGAADSWLRVDYQATSRDFWHLMDTYAPRILITTSRGGDIGWELEAVEGGHATWASDRFGTQHLPEPGSVDPRTTAALAQYGPGARLPSALPLARILVATERLDLTDVRIDEDTSGNYLSGFMGLHGLTWQRANPGTVAAGHIHVGKTLPADVARQLIEATLAEVIAAYPAPFSAPDSADAQRSCPSAARPRPAGPQTRLPGPVPQDR